MKIAFVGGFAFEPKGTMQARAFPLAEGLVRSGHAVTMFLTPYDNLSQSDTEVRREGVIIRSVKADASRWSYPALLLRLIRAVGQYGADVVHVFKPKGFAGAAGDFFRLTGKRNLVLDCDDWEGWGGFNDVKPYPWILKEYIDRQERSMMRSMPAVTVASRTLLDRVNRVRGHSSGVYYVPNCGASGENRQICEQVRGISPATIRREFGLQDGLTVLYCGHFEPEDGAMFFCEAALPVLRRAGATVVFVGEGPELGKVKELFCSQTEVKSYFFPRLPYSQFIRMVQACDVAALPYPDNAVHRAKCSARIVDYMTMGKPVITSAIGQNSEYIVQGESGILVSPESHDDFGGALETLLQDRGLREKVGANARARILEQFTWSGEPIQHCLEAYTQVARQ